MFTVLNILWTAHGFLKEENILGQFPVFKKSMKYAGKNQSAHYECNKYIGIAYWHDQKYDQARQYLIQAETLRRSCG